ncbi:probable complex I intermediate-associated protein 30 isoform X2 [Magnolia sinica]|uniref:probable complex I intermediate-associated protein 30 isoform X2 n=1 Tax=Magnolia sinica TaxID=86752 RepID=UPI00265B0046|nr:probable complex I intermediate-associated protein 30 isoform X2 [Magnolia sinica]
MSRFRALWQASLNATKKALTWNVEDLIPPSERFVFNFNSKEELKRWHLYSDSEYGGLSSASLEIKDVGNGLNGIFSGNLSSEVTEGSRWRINRSGFCGMRSKKIYTENWVNSPGQQEDNSWQAFVFVPKDNWYTAKIPLDRYLPTWRGNIIDAKLEMNPSRIVGMSLSVNAEGGFPGAKSGPGDFRLEIDWIKALRTQHMNPLGGGQLNQHCPFLGCVAHSIIEEVGIYGMREKRMLNANV